MLQGSHSEILAQKDKPVKQGPALEPVKQSQPWIYIIPCHWCETRVWELDYKESWAPRTDAFTFILFRGSRICAWFQCWILIRTDAEALILGPPDAKNWLMGKDPNAEKDWGQEDQMFAWHHWLDGHEFEPAPGVGDGQGSLASCSPWGFKQLGMTEWLNWPEYWLSREREMSLGHF